MIDSAVTIATIATLAAERAASSNW